MSELFGFHITAFPPVKLKYGSLKQRFNRGSLSFYEDEQGVYHVEYYVERMSSPIEAKLIVSPNLYEPQTKRPEITVDYVDLRYRYYARKEVVGFAIAISSQMSWKHEIVWCTEDSHIIEMKNSDIENRCPNVFQVGNLTLSRW